VRIHQCVCGHAPDKHVGQVTVDYPNAPCIECNCRGYVQNVPRTVQRKVVQVSQAGSETGYTLVALCNDGTMWYSDSCNPMMHWLQLPPIPPTTTLAEAARDE
jgi:hypothetical protein